MSYILEQKSLKIVKQNYVLPKVDWLIIIKSLTMMVGGVFFDGEVTDFLLGIDIADEVDEGPEGFLFRLADADDLSSPLDEDTIIYKDNNLSHKISNFSSLL